MLKHITENYAMLWKEKRKLKKPRDINTIMLQKKKNVEESQ